MTQYGLISSGLVFLFYFFFLSCVFSPTDCYDIAVMLHIVLKTKLELFGEGGGGNMVIVLAASFIVLY